MEIYIEDPDLVTLVHMYQGLADQNELTPVGPFVRPVLLRRAARDGGAIERGGGT